MDAISGFIEENVSAQLFVSAHVLMIMLHVILIVVACITAASALVFRGKSLKSRYYLSKSKT